VGFYKYTAKKIEQFRMTKWDVKIFQRTCLYAIVPMNPVQEKVNAVNALSTINGWENFPPVIFPTIQKEHTTAP